MKRSKASRLSSSSSSASDEKEPKKVVKKEESSDDEILSKKLKKEKVEESSPETVKVETKAEKPKKKKLQDPEEVEMPKKEQDDRGEVFFDIGRNRRVSLSNFKGTEFINIREYYEDKKSGELKPGSKGISLKKNEWQKLLTLGDQFKFAE